MATTPNTPAPAAALDQAPESDLDRDRSAANSDHPSPASPESAALSPALPATAPDRPAAPAPAPAQPIRPATLQLELRREIEWRPP
jgi:pyruvate dehydrogenase E2 component (dihydrolipoyllysine-residue acetyltransferase)